MGGTTGVCCSVSMVGPRKTPKDVCSVCMCGNNKQSSASAKVKILAGLELVILVLEHNMFELGLIQSQSRNPAVIPFRSYGSRRL
jgi:hypothetical protein